MFSIELKNGTVTVDLEKITVEDVRKAASPKSKNEEGDAVLAKATGQTVEQIALMPYKEYRRLTKFFWQCVNDPLKDSDDTKNSQSESTSA